MLAHLTEISVSHTLPSMRPSLSRRHLFETAFGAAIGVGFIGASAGCSDEDAATPDRTVPATAPGSTRWRMPAEDLPHEATWMSFPSSADVWGGDLADVQGAIADIALAIAEFEPVRMLVRPAARSLATDLMGGHVELVDGPVDDLWARDTLPLFLVDPSSLGALAAGRVRFNGWGGKQIHTGDTQLAAHVASMLDIELIDLGVTGEGGGIENDGAGTLLAARSSWVNSNRNPGFDEAAIAAALVDGLGASRMLWVDGIAGEDITDGHIDTLARFVDAATIVHEYPSYVEPGETWYDVAVATHRSLEQFERLDGSAYRLVQLTQPITTRAVGDQFLSSYVNFYVCNGAVIAPSFGDRDADGVAREVLAELHPGREVVQIDIDPLAEGGGGIHCATQQQPRVA
jgi:agmatine deiminase